MKKGKKRVTALSLVLVMVMSLVTTIPVNAGWSEDPNNNPNAERYGLWFGDSWWGEYYDSETESNKEGWVINQDGDTQYSSDKVDVKYMSDSRDIDLREVDGTIDKAFYFSYIPYTWNGEEVETDAPGLIKDADDLVISYLGTELINRDGNQDNEEARWAKDTRTTTDATIVAVDGEPGLFRIHITEPGYYIISKGELKTDNEGYFENSDGAVDFRVYKRTGLGVREARFDEGQDKWIKNTDGSYQDTFYSDLWGRAISLTYVTEGVEAPISLDELEVTYYGEIEGDPRWDTLYKETEDADGNGEQISVEKYYTPVSTKATLTKYEKDDSLAYFTPDKPGDYLISKKGITDDAENEANRKLHEQAIWVDVDNSRACFFKTAGDYSGANLLSTVWDNCYRPDYVKGQKDLEFYYRSAIEYGYDEDADKVTTRDLFKGILVSYGDGDDAHMDVNIEKDENGNIVLGDWLSAVFSMEPVDNNIGWYKITVKNLNGWLNVDFHDEWGCNAYLNVGYYEPGNIDLRYKSMNDTIYRDSENGYGILLVTAPFTASIYTADVNDGVKQVTGNDLDKYKVYANRQVTWYDEETNEAVINEGFTFNEVTRKYESEDPTWEFYPDASNPQFAIKNVDDIVSVKKVDDDLEIQINAIGDYVIVDGKGGAYFLRVDLTNLGLFTNTDRKMENGDVVENWPLEIKAYQGRTSETMYGLAWIDPEGYDKNGNKIQELDENGEPLTEDDKPVYRVNPWATDPESIEINAGVNVKWVWNEEKDYDYVTYDKLEDFISVDKDNPVKYENGVIYGYPVTLTDKIDKDFSVIMSHDRIGKNDPVAIKRDGDGLLLPHFDQVDIDYVELKDITAECPNTKYIVGETFDPTGVAIKAVYEDKEEFDVNLDDVEISIGDGGADKKLATTDTQVTIKYLGKTAYVPITVKEKENVDLSKAAWNYKEAFTADGTEKKVEITGLPETVNVKYEGNTATAVGKYTAKATITLKDEKSYTMEVPEALKTLAWEIKENTAENKAADDKKAADAATPAPAEVGATVTDTSSTGAASTATYTVSDKSTGAGDTGEVTYSGESTGSTATSVTIPDTITGSDGVTYEVTKIADNALKGNTTVKEVTVGNNIVEIGEGAFQNATKLTTVRLGSNVTTIDKNAFAGCTKLKKVTASGSKITTVAESAFKGNKALTTIDFSKSKVKTIGKNAFNGDKKLKTVKINGNSLTKVGKNAFKGIKKNATITVNAKDKKTYNKVVKLIKKSGAKNVKYKFKKKK